MKKFKVGDKVKLVSMKNEDIFYKKYLGKIFTIKQAGCVAVTFKEATEENIAPYYYNLQKVEEYTYEDLKKSPIGTKVTFENDVILVKTTEKRLESKLDVMNIENLKNLKDDYYGKIIKIEEPKYTTVYESQPEILDETEKRYLRGVIRPFKNKIKYIVKYDNTLQQEYIVIYFSDNSGTVFPTFKEDTMYKGMTPNKKYTLEELGL